MAIYLFFHFFFLQLHRKYKISTINMNRLEVRKKVHKKINEREKTQNKARNKYKKERQKRI